MRRSGLWEQAVAEADKVLKGAAPADRVCVMRFDRDVATVVGFEAWAAGMYGQSRGGAMEAIEALRPGWGATDLGRALVAACEVIGQFGLAAENAENAETGSTDEPSAVSGASTAGQVVLISDLQQGSDLGALAGYEWPAEVSLVVRAVRCEDGTNASVQWISGAQGPDAAGDEPVTVRVSNAADSTVEQFVLRWVEGDGTGDGNGAMDVYVAPGYSTVVHVGKDDGRQTHDERSPLRPLSLVSRPSDPTPGPLPLTRGGRVVLSGDAHAFDNTLYVGPQRRARLNILYVGDDDPNDPAGMLFYLRRAFAGGRGIRPVVAWRKVDEPLGAALGQADMVIAAGAMAADNAAAVRRYLESGGTALWVAKDRSVESIQDTVLSREPPAASSGFSETRTTEYEGRSETLARLAGVEGVEIGEAAVDGYAMLGRLDFRHPLLAAFGEPRFGDFSRIHFWRYRKVDVDTLPGARVFAWFDNGDPAWMEVSVGRGTLLVWACGWGRADSDLALSSKFVPLLYCCLEHGGASVAMERRCFVGDVVDLHTVVDARGGGAASPTLQDEASDGSAVPSPREGMPPEVSVRRPDGVEVALGVGRTTFAGTDLPGIYVVEGSRGVFAVNVAATESRTAVMAIEELEKMGVRFEADRAEPTATMKQRQQRASLAATEQRQKLWRWLLAAALGVLLAETILAGRLTGRPQNLQEAYHD